MNDTPLVSVIIPVHNGTTVLSDALTSVRQQTCQNFEVIVVDDGSSDGSHALAQKFADEDSRIKVLRQPNSGVSMARNAAIAHARGELIAFLDADDVWLPEKLAAQLDLLQQEPRANLLFTDYFLWDGQNDFGRRYSNPDKFPDGDVGRRLIFFDLFGMPTVMKYWMWSACSTLNCQRRRIGTCGCASPNMGFAPRVSGNHWLATESGRAVSLATHFGCARPMFLCWRKRWQDHKAHPGNVLTNAPCKSPAATWNWPGFAR